MAIKTDIAEAHAQRVRTIVNDRDLSSADKFQRIQDEFERAMERWGKVILAHRSKKREKR